MAAFPSNGRRRLPRAAAGALAVSLYSGLLAGCGGSSGAGGPGGGGPTTVAAAAPTVTLSPGEPLQSGACTVVTKADVEAAVGAKVTDAKDEPQPGRSQCTFALASAGDQKIVFVRVTSPEVPAFFASARQKALSPQTVAAGDQAFVSSGLGMVRRGNTLVTIIVALRLEPAQQAAVATKLATSVGPHL